MNVEGRSLNAWRINLARGGDIAPPAAVRLVERYPTEALLAPDLVEGLSDIGSCRLLDEFLGLLALFLRC